MQPTLAPAEIVTQSTRPGAVDGTTENSDAFIWRLLVTQIAPPIVYPHTTPSVFETWASDTDTFSRNPHFPGSVKHDFHGSVLNGAKLGNPIDVKCSAPPNPNTGAFPVGGAKACIAEEVKRNRAEFDYIVSNGLNTRAGLADAYSRSFNVNMPAAALSVKADWVPVATVIRWIPELRDIAAVEQAYVTTRVDDVEYALVSMHVASKRNGAWVWGTFEHRLTPGRCDYIGCLDTFGATTRFVPANQKAYNTQYGACPETPGLKAMMDKATLAFVWSNYCLKGTQVDFVGANGLPQSLGNQVIEGINANNSMVASSCITCHAYASFGANGKVTKGALNMLGFNATGQPNAAAVPNSLPFDFMWGVLLAP